MSNRKDTMVDTAEFARKLKQLGACDEALEWVATQPDAATAWATCHRADWLVWLRGAQITAAQITAAQIRTAITEIRYELSPSAIDALGGVTDEACDAFASALLEVYPNAGVTVRRANIDGSSMRADGEIDGTPFCVTKRHFGAPSISCDPEALEVSASVEMSIADDEHSVWERACAIAAGD